MSISIQSPEIFRENIRVRLRDLLLKANAEPLVKANAEPLVKANAEPLVKANAEPLVKANAEETAMTHAINLEKGVFNYTIRESNFRKIVKKWENPAFSQLYLDRMRSLYINLKNTDLLQQILSGETSAQSVAFMTHQEFNPIRWRTLIDKKRKRDASKCTVEIEASTDMFTCKKCKSKRCTYYELQTRSADEPATVFVTCLDCGKNWKEGG